MCKLAITSETAIMIAFLVMNLERWLKSRLFCLFLDIMIRLCRHIGSLTAYLMFSTDISRHLWISQKGTCKMNLVEIWLNFSWFRIIQEALPDNCHEEKTGRLTNRNLQ